MGAEERPRSANVGSGAMSGLHPAGASMSIGAGHRRRNAHAYRRSAYCALMPASPMTFPHFAISVRKRAAQSSGVLATGS